jgi:hypothetical protein
MEVSHPGCNIDAAATAEVCEDWEVRESGRVVGGRVCTHMCVCVWGGGWEGGEGGEVSGQQRAREW